MLFRDAKGREWSTRLDLGLCLRVRNSLRVDLLDPAKAIDVAMLTVKRELLGNILWAIVSDQAEAVGVAKDDFFAALNSEALGDAWGALADAYTDFCPSPNREAVRGAITVQIEAMAREGQRIAEVVTGPEATAAMDRAIEAAGNQALRSLATVGT